MDLLQTLSVSLHNTLIEGLESGGLLVNYVSKWCNAKFSKSVPTKMT